MIDGFQHLPGYLPPDRQREWLLLVQAVLVKAPFYRPSMPKSGRPFSILMSNCGDLGWVSDKVGGYRYQPMHPETGEPWPRMPQAFLDLWSKVAGFAAPPQACLINLYTSGTKMGSHVDADEAEMNAPVVSVSLGDEAVFHVGGHRRGDPKARVILRSGDVAVLGGAARRAYHGIDRIVPGSSDLLDGGGRLNLTFRRVTVL
ncbi:MAG: alpha-ketoglutarate-dependent dioxygenase AlkB [Alphaproteobacteria bacterium]|nr:alpha-ketoglutarate-dependent dioxygenase AlkB [Alphaproteobacteria bacterium]